MWLSTPAIPEGWIEVSLGDRFLGMGACFHGNFFAIFLKGEGAKGPGTFAPRFNTEGVPRGRGLAAPESVCLLSISFR